MAKAHSNSAAYCDQMNLNLPNAISVGRIFLVPLVVWAIISGRMQFAFVIFVLAGLSDALDGFLAKRYDWQTELGAYLDPIADKLLLVSIYIVLGLFAHLPAWLVIAVVSRDVLIIGGILLAWILERPVAMQPLLVSKANTTFQIVLASLVMGNLGFQLGLEPLILPLIWLTGLLTVLSAAAYLRAWLHHMADYEQPVAAPKPLSDAPYTPPPSKANGSNGRLHSS